MNIACKSMYVCIHLCLTVWAAVGHRCWGPGGWTVYSAATDSDKRVQSPLWGVAPCSCPDPHQSRRERSKEQRVAQSSGTVLYYVSKFKMSIYFIIFLSLICVITHIRNFKWFPFVIIRYLYQTLCRCEFGALYAGLRLWRFLFI